MIPFNLCTCLPQKISERACKPVPLRSRAPSKIDATLRCHRSPAPQPETGDATAKD
jgi:hypothetical protein